ncbi:peptidoglycan-binding protein LysM [Ligilactobacillus salitolerans]|uniref:Peptidoglycan-binding protein LysM n=1 Tax=Ligilactobacillus salitolerans TaxID=1808352 RepID=A0A401IS60_9LACO|nr:LysM domain-containing protein [Ligilactobacillus salitolerans]GBG94372.1 peptidoglycan-binding protein LysM [Ligilactobacillus salitolerans]
MKFKKTLLTISAAAGMMAAGSLAASADTVTVKAGDTLSSIAKEHNVTVDSIEKANKLSNINLIFEGQKLEVGTDAQAATSQTQQAAPQQQQKAYVPAQTQQQKPAQAQQTASASTQQPAVSQQKTSTSTTTNTSTSSSTTTSSSSSSSSEAAAKAAIAARESGGSYTASNGNYYGKYQLTKSMLNGDYSEANQEKTADAYVSSRYGSWANALKHSDQYGWY